MNFDCNHTPHSPAVRRSYSQYHPNPVNCLVTYTSKGENTTSVARNSKV